MALHAGRRARVETAIGESPASVPAAAAALAQQVFGDLRGPPRSRCRSRQDERAHGDGTSRSRGCDRRRGGEPDDVPRRGARSRARDAGDPTRRRSCRSSPAVDVVVSSTSAPGFVLDAVTAGPTCAAPQGRPLLLVDLAVPRDVDPALAAIDGCFVYDVDDLEAVVEASLAGRRAEAQPRRAHRRGRGRPLPRVAGLARGRPRDRVAPGPRRGDPRSPSSRRRRAGSRGSPRPTARRSRRSPRRSSTSSSTPRPCA